MKQRKFQLLLFTTFITLLLFSCEKDNIDITSNKWEVVKIKKQDASDFTKTKESYILEFVNDSTLTLSLDVNTCHGSYNIPTKGNIEIDRMVCTKICCDDSEFANDLSALFPKMTSYHGKGNKLIFEGSGEIVFKKK